MTATAVRRFVALRRCIDCGTLTAEPELCGACVAALAKEGKKR